MLALGRRPEKLKKGHSGDRRPRLTAAVGGIWRNEAVYKQTAWAGPGDLLWFSVASPGMLPHFEAGHYPQEYFFNGLDTSGTPRSQQA